MSAQPPRFLDPSANVFRALAAVRRVGKPSSSSTLNAKRDGEDGFAHETSAKSRVFFVSQAGTNDSAPLWNGPRLRSAFVAQVMGQVLMDARVRAQGLAAPAYRRTMPQTASRLLLDRAI
jgi:hypothetical protein